MNPKEAIDYLSNLPFDRDVGIKIIFGKKANFNTIEELISHCSAVCLRCQNDYNLAPRHLFKIIKSDKMIDYDWIPQTLGEQVWVYCLFSTVEDKLVWENGDSELFDKSLLHPYILNKDTFTRYKVFQKYLKK